MANSKSAIKRIEIAERNRLRNKSYKSAVKSLMKNYFAAVDEYVATASSDNKDKVEKALSKTYSKIDKAVKRGVLHANNGARKKARLAKYWKQSSASQTQANSGTEAVASS
ncbi:MAG: 30S ribosomal protein S20 [Kamptonema sp. SIO4C4]|nr:30S ribosomal protein S20 [Kamptonema sp. SIO4C4]